MPRWEHRDRDGRWWSAWFLLAAMWQSCSLCSGGLCRAARVFTLWRLWLWYCARYAGTGFRLWRLGT
jgi:hypothetical protein